MIFARCSNGGYFLRPKSRVETRSSPQMWRELVPATTNFLYCVDNAPLFQSSEFQRRIQRFYRHVFSASG